MELLIEDHLIMAVDAEPERLALIRELCARKDLQCRIDGDYSFIEFIGSKKQLYNMLLEITIYFPIDRIITRMAPLNYDEIDINEVDL